MHSGWRGFHCAGQRQRGISFLPPSTRLAPFPNPSMTPAEQSRKERLSILRGVFLRLSQYRYICTSLPSTSSTRQERVLQLGWQGFTFTSFVSTHTLSLVPGFREQSI